MHRVLCRSAALVVVLMAGMIARAEEAPRPRLVTVTGTAEIDVAPDQVVITCTVETLNSDIVKAEEEADGILTQLRALAQHAGIEDNKVQTTHVYIVPLYRWENDSEKFQGYQVSQTVALTLNDLSKYRPLLTGALKSGLKRVDRIEFRSTRLIEHRAEARQKAIVAARAKAEAMAEALGVHLGRPHHITELVPPAFESPMWQKTASSANFVAEGGGNASGSSEGLAPGQLRIDARVEIAFELLD